VGRLAFSATGHCRTGCAIGEVLGLIIANALGRGNVASIALAIVLAFFFGYSLTMVPLLRAEVALASAIPLAFASDTLSMTVMESVDNLIMLLIPGAMDASSPDLLFWGSLAVALAVDFVAAFPVNRYLMARGKGHAVVHEYHHGDHEQHHGGHGHDHQEHSHSRQHGHVPQIGG
jgi:ABC-type nickel/cobalt efflux system permease component RcnA